MSVPIAMERERQMIDYEEELADAVCARDIKIGSTGFAIVSGNVVIRTHDALVSLTTGHQLGLSEMVRLHDFRLTSR